MQYKHPAVKLQSLIHTQLSLFKMQIETATYTIMDKFVFSSQIVRGNCFKKKKKRVSVIDIGATSASQMASTTTKDSQRKRDGRQAGRQTGRVTWCKNMTTIHTADVSLSKTQNLPVVPRARLWSWAWPLTPLRRVADKKRFSQWGLIKYHIIIWMQLIVS